uniref:Uncharacterized protein n=1 Tax=Oryza nivara TaxID=4536 RepID=A0A0E0J1I8_ORYNI
MEPATAWHSALGRRLPSLARAQPPPPLPSMSPLPPTPPGTGPGAGDRFSHGSEEEKRGKLNRRVEEEGERKR